MIGALHNLYLDSRTDRWLVGGASVLLCIVSYLLFYDVGPMSLSPEAVPLGKISTEGKVRRRHAGSLYWSDLNHEATVYLRDILYTPKNTVAELVWSDNKRLRLEPDTMVQLDEVTLGRIEIVLREWEKAKVAGKAPAIPSMEVAVPKPLPIRLLPYPKTARLQLNLPSDELEAETLKELTQRVVRLEEKTLTLLSPKEVRLPNRQIFETRDFAIALLNPKNEKINIAANQWLKFEWSEIPMKGFAYVLEIGRDPKFRSVVNHSTKSNTLSLQIGDPGTYYWRVKAIRGNEIILSKPSAFVMSRRGGADPFSERLPTGQPTGFLWEVSTDKDFAESLKNSVGKKAECPQAGYGSGTYYCRVRDIGTNQIVKEYTFDIP